MATLTICLPESVEAFFDEQLETRGYGNVNEYVHRLPREAQAKEQTARLETVLQEGLDAKTMQILEKYPDRKLIPGCLEADSCPIATKGAAGISKEAVLF